MSDVQQVTIGGKRFAFKRVRLHTIAGDCTDPDEPHRMIRVDSKLKGEAELDTILHELLHAADWSKDEDWIGDRATEIARVLWRLGYRKGEGT